MDRHDYHLCNKEFSWNKLDLVGILKYIYSMILG